MERWGVAGMIMGIGVFVAAWWVARPEKEWLVPLESESTDEP